MMTKEKTKVLSLFKQILIMSFLAFINGACGKSNSESVNLEDPVKSQIIVGSLDWEEVTSLSSSSPIRQNANAVADIDLPALGTRCTGFMISADILMTNQHCIPTSRHARGVTAAFKHEKGVSESNWKKHDCSTFVGNNRALDFALLKCQGSPGLKYGIVELSSDEVNVGHELYVVQQNCDYYFKRNCDWSKKYSLGQVTKKEDELAHDADTLGGSSGSPVFSSSSNEVIAIHHAGFGNNGFGRGIENYAVPMSKIVPYILTHFPQVDLGGSSSNDEPSEPVEKPFEPNESFSKALKISKLPFSDNKLEISSPSDKDYFKFISPVSGEFKVSIKFSHSKGDLELKVYNSSKKEIAKSTSVFSKEAVSFKASKGKNYYIFVYGYRGAIGDYSLSINFEEGISAVFDKEPNNTVSNAVKVSSGSQGKGQISSSSDIDVFKLVVSSSKKVKITLSMSSGAGDLDLFLVDDDIQEVAKSTSTGKVESFSKSVSAGTYYIVVQGYREAVGAYQLEVQ